MKKLALLATFALAMTINFSAAATTSVAPDDDNITQVANETKAKAEAMKKYEKALKEEAKATKDVEKAKKKAEKANQDIDKARQKVKDAEKKAEGL